MEKGQGNGTDTLQTDNVITRKEYIEREAFITRQRELYCQNCDRRRCMKDGKLTKRFVYPIGGAPCRACDVDDMINAVEDYPAADVVTRDCYDRLLAENDELRKERPVVRCKDCKYSAVDFEDRRYCKLVTYYNHVPDDWFCADGERKDCDGDGI